MPNAHPRPWHRGSVYGDGPRLPMCRERRAVWRARLNMHRRSRQLTPLHEDIGHAMLKRLSADGRLDPSQATIANDIGCSERTIRRALERLAACGLVMWANRLVRTGWRTQQASNAYILTLGTPPICSGGQRVRETPKELFSTVQPPATSADIREAQAALAQRRAAIEARLLHRKGGF